MNYSVSSLKSSGINSEEFYRWLPRIFLCLPRRRFCALFRGTAVCPSLSLKIEHWENRSGFIVIVVVVLQAFLTKVNGNDFENVGVGMCLLGLCWSVSSLPIIVSLEYWRAWRWIREENSEGRWGLEQSISWPVVSWYDLIYCAQEICVYFLFIDW